MRLASKTDSAGCLWAPASTSRCPYSHGSSLLPLRSQFTDQTKGHASRLTREPVLRSSNPLCPTRPPEKHAASQRRNNNAHPSKALLLMHSELHLSTKLPPSSSVSEAPSGFGACAWIFACFSFFFLFCLPRLNPSPARCHHNGKSECWNKKRSFDWNTVGRNLDTAEPEQHMLISEQNTAGTLSKLLCFAREGHASCHTSSKSRFGKDVHHNQIVTSDSCEPASAN